MRSMCRNALVVSMAALALAALTAAPALASGKPFVETKAATEIYGAEAFLHGVVNPNGAETKYHFEYGTTTSYGKKTAEVGVGSGVTNLEESQGIGELTPSTKYHFRIVATNANGTGNGSDEVFTTAAKQGLPEFVVDEGHFPIALRQANPREGVAIADIAGNRMECEGDIGKGEVTGAKAITLKLELENCHSGSGITKKVCTSEDAEKGHIVTNGSGRLYYVEKATKTVGVLLKVVTVECGFLFRTRGAAVVRISPVNIETKAVDLPSIRGNGKGKNNQTKYENEKGEAKTELLEWEFGNGEHQFAIETGEQIALEIQSEHEKQAFTIKA